MISYHFIYNWTYNQQSMLYFKIVFSELKLTPKKGRFCDKLNQIRFLNIDGTFLLLQLSTF